MSMRLKNSTNHYGWVSILLHWVIAVAFFSLFILGDYMLRLDYYHPWYQSAPDWHKSMGLLFIVTLVMRFTWRLYSPKPEPLSSHQTWEVFIATVVHWIFYLLLFIICISGYLITSADANPISVFSLFEIPVLNLEWQHQADDAGLAHWLMAYICMGLVGLHVIAALKHHFIDHDMTLKRIIKSD